MARIGHATVTSKTEPPQSLTGNVKYIEGDDTLRLNLDGAPGFWQSVVLYVSLWDIKWSLPTKQGTVIREDDGMIWELSEDNRGPVWVTPGVEMGLDPAEMRTDTGFTIIYDPKD